MFNEQAYLDANPDVKAAIQQGKFQTGLQHFTHHGATERRPPNKYYFTIAAIFKNEEQYIADWIQYHLGIGAEHIYLYNDNSTDDSVQKALQAGGDKTTITTIGTAPTKDVQKICHPLCLKHHRLESRWIAFIDIDEYLVPKKHIHNILKEYEYAPALCIHWVLFGSNGHLTASQEPVPIRFTKSESGVNKHVKSIVNPLRTIDCLTAHRFTHDGIAVDEHHNQIARTDSTPGGGTKDKIYIAHYCTKSQEEFLQRRSQPRANRSVISNMQQFWESHDKNEIENLDVLKIWNTIACQ